MRHTNPCCVNPAIGIEEFVSRDTLRLKSDTHSYAIPRESIAEISRWNAGRSHKAAGAGLGFIIGALGGGAIGYSTGCAHCDGDWRPLTGIGGAIVGGVTGAVAGIVIGSARHGFWEIVR